MPEITDAQQLERTAAMRALTDEQRRASIAAARNVIGFERFAAHCRQRDLATAYRSPEKPA